MIMYVEVNWNNLNIPIYEHKEILLILTPVKILIFSFLASKNHSPKNNDSLFLHIKC